MNSIPDEVWFADAQKKISLVNPAVLNEFGSSTFDNADVEAIAGSSEVYRPDGTPRPVEEAPPLRALKGEIIRNQEEIVRTPASGELRYRQVNAGPVKDADGNIIGSVSVVRDITERKQKEHRVRRYNQILEGINRIFSNIVQAKTEEELGDVCLSVALEITGGGIGFINLVGDDGLMHDIAISEGGWDQCLMYDKTGHRRPPGDFLLHGLYGHVVKSEKSFFTNNPSLHPESIGLPKDHPPLTSFLGVPLSLRWKNNGYGWGRKSSRWI